MPRRPVAEVGYAKRATARIQEHASFKSTNYIMSIFRLIFRDKFSARFFDIEGHVIFRCITHDAASIGEILLTTLAQAYIVDGGGFCHQPAGQNVGSANDIEHFRCKFFKLQAMEDDAFTRRMEDKITMAMSTKTDCPKNTISEYVVATKEVEEMNMEMERLGARAVAVVKLEGCLGDGGEYSSVYCAGNSTG